MNSRIDEIVFSVSCFIEDHGEGILLALGVVVALIMLLYWLS
jgi:hypothetical protein